jgi:prepilin-type N-terminal cleavage/methylation domain-containing protein
MPRFHAIKRRRGAFTLLEMLVSVSVLALIVVVLTGMFDQTSRIWSQGESSNARRRSARAVADFIAADLRGAAIPVSGRETSGRGNLQFVVNPSQISANYRFPHTFFWQAPVASDTSLGDLAEVGYFIRWVGDSGKVRPVLCRFFVNPSRTQGGAVVVNPDYLIYSATPTEWLSDELLERVAPADQASGYLGLMAEDVLGLWVRCYGLNGNELPNFDSRSGYTHEYTYTRYDGGGASTVNASVPRYLPARVEVSLVQLDSKVANRLLEWSGNVAGLQSLVSDPAIQDAAGFVAKVQSRTDPLSRQLIPGLRTAQATVYLDNAR